MRELRRAAGVMAAVVAVATMVGSCTGSGNDDYCAALTDEQATLERLSSRAGEPGSGAFGESVDVFERLADAAPEDLQDEWTTYVNAWHGLEDALDAAGVDASVFRDGERPQGVGQDEYDAVRDAADKMRSQPVVDAALGIEQHATDVCGVDLGGAGL